MQPATSTSKYFLYFNIIPATLPAHLFVPVEWLVASSLYLPLKSFLSLLAIADYAENAVTSFNPNRSLETKQILFYCRADWLYL